MCTKIVTVEVLCRGKYVAGVIIFLVVYLGLNAPGNVFRPRPEDQRQVGQQRGSANDEHDRSATFNLAVARNWLVVNARHLSTVVFNMGSQALAHDRMTKINWRIGIQHVAGKVLAAVTLSEPQVNAHIPDLKSLASEWYGYIPAVPAVRGLMP